MKNKIKKITASLLTLLITFLSSTASNVVSAKMVDFTTQTTQEEVQVQSLNSDICKQINKYRKSKNAKSLKIKSDLTAMAKVRAKEISKLFEHERPNGKSLLDLAYQKKAGDYFMFGENLARIKGYSGLKNISKSVVDAWDKSKGHRKVMQGKKYKYIGCAFYIKKDTIYIVTIYAY